MQPNNNSSRAGQGTGEGPGQHVPLRSITAEGLLRAVEAEAETLSIIHVRIQKQLQNLETEEKLLQHMVNRTRSRHTDQELQAFDEQYAQDKAQQQQQRRRQQPVPPGGQQAATQQQQPQQQQPQQDTQQQPGSTPLQGLLWQHPLLSAHRQHFRPPQGAAGPQAQQQQQLQREPLQQQEPPPP